MPYCSYFQVDRLPKIEGSKTKIQEEFMIMLHYTFSQFLNRRDHAGREYYCLSPPNLFVNGCQAIMEELGGGGSLCMWKPSIFGNVSYIFHHSRTIETPSLFIICFASTYTKLLTTAATWIFSHLMVYVVFHAMQSKRLWSGKFSRDLSTKMRQQRYLAADC